MSNVEKFTIECEMDNEWKDHFISMLGEMERLGNLGSSRIIAFYSDGDGSFRPKFKFNTEYSTMEPKKIIENYIKLYDRG